jgi:hypothetical protein
MKKNFFYKIESSQLLSEIVAKGNGERGKWVTQFAIDLAGSCEETAETNLAKLLISEANEYRRQQSEHGSKGGKPKHRHPKGTLTNPIGSSTLPLPISSSSNKKNKSTGFQPPTLDEVKAYCKERDNSVNPDKWYNFYESKGWMIGKNKMKSWKAAVRTWEEDKKETTGTDYGQY